MIKSICNNYLNYPFYAKTAKYLVLGVGISVIDSVFNLENDTELTYTLDQKIVIMRMLAILLVEIEDWEWVTVMDESKQEYIDLIYKKFSQEINKVN